jgi:hypothetical protein
MNMRNLSWRDGRSRGCVTRWRGASRPGGRVGRWLGRFHGRPRTGLADGIFGLRCAARSGLQSGVPARPASFPGREAGDGARPGRRCADDNCDGPAPRSSYRTAESCAGDQSREQGWCASRIIHSKAYAAAPDQRTKCLAHLINGANRRPYRHDGAGGLQELVLAWGTTRTGQDALSRTN